MCLFDCKSVCVCFVCVSGGGDLYVCMYVCVCSTRLIFISKPNNNMCIYYI